MRIIFITLLFVASSMIIIGYVKSQLHCKPPKIEYRYIPRTFKEEQENPTPVIDLYADMFAKSTPWMNYRLLGSSSNRHTEVNKFFLNQSKI